MEGAAVSDHSAVVGDRPDLTCHMLCRKYLGCRPYISFGDIRAVFLSVSGLLTVFASMEVLAFGIGMFTGSGIKFVADFWFPRCWFSTRFLARWLVRVSFNPIWLVIVTGNPGVTARDPYPTRGNPYPSTRVGVSAGRGRVFFIITTGCGFTHLL